MKTIYKTLLYPIVALIIIILMSGICWLLTAFFAMLFSTDISTVVNSPIILLYVIAMFGVLYMTITCFQAIEKL